MMKRHSIERGSSRLDLLDLEKIIIFDLVKRPGQSGVLFDRGGCPKDPVTYAIKRDQNIYDIINPTCSP